MSIRTVKLTGAWGMSAVGAVFLAAAFTAAMLPGQYIDPVTTGEDEIASDERTARADLPVITTEVFVKAIAAEKDTPEVPVETAPVAVAPVVPDAGQDVKAALTLKGTYVSGQPKESIAIVKWRDRGDELYFAGEQIAESGGVSIERVYYDYIEVKRGNAVVRIDVEQAKSTAASGRAASSRPGRPAEAAPSEPPIREPVDIQDNDEFKPRKFGANKFMINKNELAPYLKQPEKLFTEMRVTPQVKDGDPTGGYMLSGMQSNALLRKVGLRDGDVIQRVNGQNPINLMSIIADPAVNEIHVEYLRGGRMQTLHYTIQN